MLKLGSHKLGSHKLYRAAAPWQGAAFSALNPWAKLNTEAGIWNLHSFSRSHFTFSTLLQTSGQPFFKHIFCLIWLLKILIPLLMLVVFLKHRKHCQRVSSYLLFIPFESFYPNDWVHGSFHLCEISSGCECVRVVWTLFHFHVARVKICAICIQTALWLLILGLSSLYLSRWWGLALSCCWIKHLYPTFWEIFIFKKKKNPAYFSSSSVRSPS